MKNKLSRAIFPVRHLNRNRLASRERIAGRCLEHTTMLRELQPMRQGEFIAMLSAFYNKQSRPSYRVRHDRKRCVYTGRSRAFIQLTRSGRHAFKLMYGEGRLFSVYYSSW